MDYSRQHVLMNECQVFSVMRLLPFVGGKDKNAPDFKRDIPMHCPKAVFMVNDKIKTSHVFKRQRLHVS